LAGPLGTGNIAGVGVAVAIMVGIVIIGGDEFEEELDA